MIDDANTGDYDRFDELAEEFAGRYRLGERPSLQEYVDRLPEMEEAIRDLFPALVEVERVERAREPQARPTTSPPQGHTPDRLADFRIIGEIGRGGMGVVYEAEQISLGRRVALKVLPLTLKRDARALVRFRREARSAAQLHHTNIVPVFEVGEDGDSAFYAMQFIRGQGLNLVIEELKRLRDRSRTTANPVVAADEDGGGPSVGSTEMANSATEAYSLDRMAQSLLIGRFVDETAGPETVGAASSWSTDGTQAMSDDAIGLPGVPAESESSEASPSAVWPGGCAISMTDSPGRRQPFFRSVAEIGRQVAGGLAYAHARGIVHRDIKPANLLLDTAGVAWIADFGLAKSGDDSLTETGDILGTLRFMAPERFRGEGDGRADIYALGVTLYEMLTLRPAYESADRLRLIEQVRNVEPARPRSIDLTIPRDLETIVLKAMAKEPSARYATGSEMSEDLRRFLAGESIQARRTSSVERFWRWSRRNPLAASLAGVVMGMMIVVAVATSLSARREHKMRVDADLARKDAEKALSDLREARSEESTFRRAIAAERENLSKDPTNRDILGSLDALYSQQAALQRRTGRKADAVETSLQRRDLDAGSPERLYQVAQDFADCLPRPGSVRRPGDLDGRGADRAADLAIDTLGRALLAGFHGVEYNTAFTVGSNVSLQSLHDRAAFRSLQSAIGLSRGTGELASFRGHRAWVENVAVSLDGKKAISVGGDLLAYVWDMASGKLIHQACPDAKLTQGVAISPDGRTAAFGCRDGVILLWDLDRGAEAARLAGGGGNVRCVAFTSDGKTLVATAAHSIHIWDVEGRSQRRSIEGHPGALLDIALTPDGHRAVTVGEDETVRVWDLDAGHAVGEPLRGHHGRLWSVAVTPDGRRAVSGGDDGCLIVWDLVAGRRLRTLRNQGATIRDIAISPDGRRVLSGGPLNRLLYWDLESGRELHRFLGDFNGGMVGVAISPDGRRGVTGSTDGVARVWTLSDDAALARDLAATGRWDEALDAYERAMKAEPEDESLLNERSKIAWGLGRWQALLFDHREYLRHHPEHRMGELNQARLMLMAGDRDGYRRACAAMERRIKASTGGEFCELALASMLAPDSGIEPADVIALASASVEYHPQVPWAHHALALAQHRAGRDKQAILTLLNLTHLYPDWNHLPSIWPVLALAYHRIGNAAEAAKWLAKTREIRKSKTPRFGRDPIVVPEPWSEFESWIDFELLAREAEATLGSKTR